MILNTYLHFVLRQNKTQKSNEIVNFYIVDVKQLLFIDEKSFFEIDFKYFRLTCQCQLTIQIKAEQRNVVFPLE